MFQPNPYFLPVYGYDLGKEGAAWKNRCLQRTVGGEITRIGRVPWIAGGDWNEGPEEVYVGDIPGVKVRSSGEPTCDTGSELDWFMTNIRESEEDSIYVDIEAGVSVHRPVIFTIPRGIEGDLGKRLKRPRAFTGVLRNQLKGVYPRGRAGGSDFRLN